MNGFLQRGEIVLRSTEIATRVIPEAPVRKISDATLPTYYLTGPKRYGYK